MVTMETLQALSIYTVAITPGGGGRERGREAAVDRGRKRVGRERNMERQ